MSKTSEKKAETVTCERCVRGTVKGPNGERWRCAYCRGTGATVREAA